MGGELGGWSFYVVHLLCIFSILLGCRLYCDRKGIPCAFEYGHCWAFFSGTDTHTYTGRGGGAGRVTRLPVCASFWMSNGGGEEVEFWLWIPGGCMAKYLEYVISSLCPVCFACAWGVGVGLGGMRWGDCCGSAGSWRHEKGERLGLLTLGFDLDTTVVSLLSPAGHKLSSTDTIVAVFCCGGRRYDETAARHAQNHTLRRNVKPSRDRNGRPWL